MNHASMLMDTTCTCTVAGLFSIHIGQCTTTVDEPLFNYITMHMNDSAAPLARKMNLIELNQYIANLIDFMLKVKMKLAVIMRKIIAVSSLVTLVMMILVPVGIYTLHH
jgi:hypothetical protein